MPPFRVWRRLAVTGIAASLAGTSLAGQSVRADLVLLNGKIITVDPADRIAQAVAIADGKIIAVGTDADVSKFIGPNTERLDLKGHTLTPGLIDAHAHFNWGGAERLYSLNLSYPGVKNIPQVVAKLAEQAAKTPAGSFIAGVEWDDGKLDERRKLTAKDLDPATPNNPVYLNHSTGHFGVANSAALKLAHITKETPDPPGGTIDHYPDGTPTGVLKESAQGLVRRLMPPRTDVMIEAGMRDLAKGFNAEGMTGLKDPGVSPAAWESYK
ncbi:MAG: amidohydrolase family protein, partial [Gemmatimonadaceae bacterium]